MARLYTSKRGKSHSKRPISKTPPSWLQYSPEEVKKLVVQLAREGHSKSMIGQILRDKYGVPLVKPITGMTITEILVEAGEKVSLTEDLDNLLERARRMREHLARNRSDRLGRHDLQLVESKIRRLAKYYIKKGVLPKDWKYKPEIEIK
ncbi:MAG TPA: 30S ribosomal protein S15 [Candidatus Bathyarchaeota archaeon]|nr:30S ribosomal protein S15 [Candidatus Bathyarchaeota archaeon]